MSRRRVIAAVGTVLVLLSLLAGSGLLFSGLGDLRIGEPRLGSNEVVIPVTVPNRGFIPLSGRVTILLLDGAGRVLTRSENPIEIPAGQTTTRSLTMKLPAQTAPARVRLEGSVSVPGLFTIPLPPLEKGLSS